VHSGQAKQVETPFSVFFVRLFESSYNPFRPL
jgi:hypothetical protein